MNNLLSERYLLIKQIGSGGMADVFLANDTVLKREVAIKILRGDLSSDPVALLRFQREANAASGLNHENIVDVYDVGEDQGRHYIVMELLRGKTLKELVQRRGSLDKYEAVSIMEQLVSALIKAHENNVIHRDIKPQNILVKDDGTVKIADFGIALAGDALQLTKDDSVLGSVHYMAPECSRGEGASFQSDIYALGVVFYELLSGVVPYRGETPVEIAMKHMRDPFPSILDSNNSLPTSLANIISKATHKNRSYRYPSAEVFLEDLETSLDEGRTKEALWVPILESDEGTKLIDKLDDVENPSLIRKSSKRKRLIISALMTLLIVGVFILVLNLKPIKETPVLLPDFTGKAVTEVVQELNKMGMRPNPNYTYQYSDEFEAGTVIESRPLMNTEMRKGDSVRLTVSEGLTLEVTDFTGLTSSDVQSFFSGYNVRIKIKNKFDKNVPLDHIISQEGLLFGDRVNPGRLYDLILTVSSNIEMPIPSDILGRNVYEVEKELSAMGVHVRIEKLTNPNIDDIYDVVTHSNPIPGSYYIQSEGREVTLYYYDIKDKPVEVKPTIDEVVEDPIKPDNSNNQNNSNNQGKPSSNSNQGKPSGNSNNQVKPNKGDNDDDDDDN